MLRTSSELGTLYEATTLIRKINNTYGDCIIVHTDYWYNEDYVEQAYSNLERSIACYIRKPGTFTAKQKSIKQWKPAEYDITIDVRKNKYFVPGVKTVVQMLLGA